MTVQHYSFVKIKDRLKNLTRMGGYNGIVRIRQIKIVYNFITDKYFL